jgi:DNA-binding beta-propeller fold protein YncE
MATDATGLVYIADAGSGFVHKFDPLGEPLLSFAPEGMRRATGIAVDLGGAIYVADYARETVLVFFPDGSKLREMRGSPRQPFRGPVGVAVDGEGNLFVVEFDAHRIQKFDSRGRFVKAWGKDGSGTGEFHFPVGAAMGPDGFLYVADTHNRRIEKFTRDGAFVAAWGSAGTAPDQMGDVTGIAVSDKYVFVADSGNHRIALWTLDGHHKLTESLADRVQTEMETPTAVALGPHGELLVLDPAGARVLRFRINF